MHTADTELFKDKIEINLDGRQIFYLFFGGAVIASMVFVLGVMVGRRVEARTYDQRRAVMSAALDPLAALDQIEGKGNRLAFPDALRGDSPVASFGLVDDAVASAEKAAPALAESAKVVDIKDTKAKDAISKSVKASTPETKTEKKPAAGQESSATNVPAASPAQSDEDKSEANFTLQLSSFQAREDADNFYSRVKSAGDSPYITKAEVPEKGTWYRVRVGHYKTHDDALAAKAAFEKKHKMIAYVTRIR